MRGLNLSLHSACVFLDRSAAGPRGVVGIFILVAPRRFLGGVAFSSCWVCWVVYNDRFVSMRYFTNSFLCLSLSLISSHARRRIACRD